MVLSSEKIDRNSVIPKVQQLVVDVLLTVLHQVLVIASIMMPATCVETFFKATIIQGDRCPRRHFLMVYF